MVQVDLLGLTVDTARRSSTLTSKLPMCYTFIITALYSLS